MNGMSILFTIGETTIAITSNEFLDWAPSTFIIHASGGGKVLTRGNTAIYIIGGTIDVKPNYSNKTEGASFWVGSLEQEDGTVVYDGRADRVLTPP